MSAEKKQKGIFHKIWDWLCSLKVNVIILILLALTSIFGTVIPQHKPADIYIKFAGPRWYEFFKATQLDDMYHSYWFIALLALLCVTITCCSIDKFPTVWRFVSKPKKDLDNTQVKVMGLKETLTVKGSVENITGRYESFLKKAVTTPEHTEIDGIHHLFAQTGLWTRFGVYVTHSSLLIIIIGALIGVFWGEKGYIAIPEFMSASEFQLRDGKGTMKDLGFTLRNDGYETLYYEDSRQPREYKSDITLIDGGKEKFRKIVKVNHTLQYKGYTFYMANFGPVNKQVDTFYTLLDIVRKSDGKTLAKNALLYNEKISPIPGTNDKLELVAFEEFSRYGPMAGLKLHKADGTTDSFWAYPRYKNAEDERDGDYKFLVTRVKQLQFAGFQVAKDPGVWTVYTGCGLMIIGTLIAFFMFHKRFWIRVEEGEEGKVKVTMAASTNKNKETFEREFNIIREKFIRFEA